MTTEIIKAYLPNGEIDKASIKKAAEIIANGGLVVMPTETVYGLGGDGTNPLASSKIYEAKGRPSDNPLIIHISKPEDAEKYAHTCKVYYDIAKAFMPGPITVVLDAKPSVPKETRGGLDTVAVRCPSNKVANMLIEYAGVPIAAPSANLSGSPSPTSLEHVIDDMNGRVDAIIDGGNSEIGLESTIVKINADNTLTLLRPGKITLGELMSVAPINVADAVVNKLSDNEKAISPGMKYRHYAPKAPLFLIDGNIDDMLSYIGEKKQGRVAVICYSEDVNSVKEHLCGCDVYEFGNRSDEMRQAYLLFSILRDTDKKKYDVIYAPLPEQSGVGLALYNRMIRAAAHQIITLGR
jgi:L-threonylcarbamoyladenylate synthase